MCQKRLVYGASCHVTSVKFNETEGFIRYVMTSTSTLLHNDVSALKIKQEAMESFAFPDKNQVPSRSFRPCGMLFYTMNFGLETRPELKCYFSSRK